MEAPRTDEDIRDVNTRYHDVAADSYDAKWGIDFGEPGQAQVLMKLRKVLGATRSRAASGARWRSAPAPATSRSTCCRPASIREATCTDISPGMLATLRGNAERLGLDGRDGRDRRRARCRSRTRAFDLVLGHAILHHIPDLARAFAEFHRVLKPGGTVVFAGEPSRYGDRLARVPKRGAARGRAAVAAGDRRARGAAPARTGTATARPARRGPRARALRRHPRVRARRPRGARARRRLRGRARARRGAGRELVRLDEPRARGDRRPRGRAVGLAPVRLPRLPGAAAARPAAARGPAAGGDLLQPAGLRRRKAA